MKNVKFTVFGKTYTLKVPDECTIEDIVEYLGKKKNVPIDKNTRLCFKVDVPLDTPIDRLFKGNVHIHASLIVDEIEDTSAASTDPGGQF